MYLLSVAIALKIGSDKVWLVTTIGPYISRTTCGLSRSHGIHTLGIKITPEEIPLELGLKTRQVNPGYRASGMLVRHRVPVSIRVFYDPGKNPPRLNCIVQLIPRNLMSRNTADHVPASLLWQAIDQSRFTHHEA
jgi:hypothetical protein